MKSMVATMKGASKWANALTFLQMPIFHHLGFIWKIRLESPLLRFPILNHIPSPTFRTFKLIEIRIKMGDELILVSFMQINGWKNEINFSFSSFSLIWATNCNWNPPKENKIRNRRCSRDLRVAHKCWILFLFLFPFIKSVLTTSSQNSHLKHPVQSCLSPSCS